ncbi:nitrogenase component 1 [Ferrovum myxofaciens]|uniref:nitrogenase component 1 n=1 Tax=Ferrovum myxofaciens TaxID=416213 RepID=UPI00235557F4|nr:nitrogenase component 1 [Ferrovum myxofaciens]
MRTQDRRGWCGADHDMVHISHGPVGCGQYSWAARRKLLHIGTTGWIPFVTMQFTSTFRRSGHCFWWGQETREDHGFEIEDLFPLNKGITVQSECPIGLIGDDIEAGIEEEVEGVWWEDDCAGAMRRVSWSIV